MRRPPVSCMPRQFLKESVISLRTGMVVMVLSQLRTLTVCSATSITSPSAFWLGISIQSPIRTMSLVPSCTPATTDRMVS